MAGDTQITIVGNLTADPEIRYTPSGAAVADFTVASTPRTFDRNANEWRDGETLFLRCSVWREQAENIAESLRKGMRVIAQGRLTQRSYETREGQQRTVVELQVDEVGPSLRNARAQVTKTPRPQPQGGYQPAPQTNPGPGQQWDQPAGGQADDPWRTQGQPPQPPQPAPQPTQGQWGPEQGYPQPQHPTDPPF